MTWVKGVNGQLYNLDKYSEIRICEKSVDGKTVFNVLAEFFDGSDDWISSDIIHLETMEDATDFVNALFIKLGGISMIRNK